MKRIAFISILLSILCFGCGEDFQSLEGTRWKLAGIVDAETGTLQVLEPKDCEKCYTLAFYTYTTYSALSSFEHTGTYQVDYATYGIRIISFGGPKLPEQSKEDGELYCNTFVSVQSFSCTKKELRLYYNDKKNYLLYKRKQS